MPPKNNPQKGQMPDMIQFKLNADELLQFDEWLVKHGKTFDNDFQDTLLNDHKIGVSWDAYNDCFIASQTGKGDRNRNSGLCLNSRATDWREAVALNMFKTEVIFNRGVWQPRKDDNQRG